MRRWMLPLALLGALVGCKDNQDPDGADAPGIGSTRGLPHGARAPGYAKSKASFTAHARAVDIYVNPTIAQALEAQAPLRAWPEGSMVVKDGFSKDGDLAIVAVMEKRSDGWYWVEFDGEGEPLFSGRPRVCIDCHARSAHDFTWGFGLP